MHTASECKSAATKGARRVVRRRMADVERMLRSEREWKTGANECMRK